MGVSPLGRPGVDPAGQNLRSLLRSVYRRKNRWEAKGIFADGARIEAIRQQLLSERADPAYERKLINARKRREVKQAEYTESFRSAVKTFLRFAPVYAALETTLAEAVTQHAVPVGSGTVARTERIPLERRAEAAVIAWMRHQTTAYDHMSIARVKGERREVRRKLAERSRELLERYRRGEAVPADDPLQQAFPPEPKTP